MSKNNNVNPGQYKVAGRERQGEQLQQTEDKQALTKQRATAERAANERADAESRHSAPPVREQYPGPQEASTGERTEPGGRKAHP
jgi:hypothetical protein